MKKISYLSVILFLFSMFFSFANAEVSKQQANNIRINYQTYLNKMRSCSPYTYNADGDKVISRILGMYNRRCVIRTYTYDSTVECIFKMQDLKNYVKAMPTSYVYLESLNKTPDTLDLKSSEILKKYNEINQQYKDSGICKSDGGSEENKN